MHQCTVNYIFALKSSTNTKDKHQKKKIRVGTKKMLGRASGNKQLFLHLMPLFHEMPESGENNARDLIINILKMC